MTKLNSSGFTVIELAVVTTVTTILIIVVSAFFINNLQQSTLATAKGNMLDEVQHALDLIANDIRLSSNADDNNRWPDNYSPGGSSNPYSWQSNSNTLVLATAVEDSTGGIIFTDAKNYITEKNNIVYFVNNNTLYKRTLASTSPDNIAKTTCPATHATSTCPADKELLHNVANFNISYRDGQNNSVTPTNARSVEISLTASKYLYKNNVKVDYKTRMVFRND